MAVEGYQSILNSGFESAELYYNLGNAFYKLNNIPESNFFYEKAKSISPSDEDILMNLSFAQNLRIDKIGFQKARRAVNPSNCKVAP